MAFAFGRATPSLRQAPSMCLDNPVPGNVIFSLNGEHHLLLKVLHFRVDKKEGKCLIIIKSCFFIPHIRRDAFHCAKFLTVVSFLCKFEVKSPKKDDTLENVKLKEFG